MADRFGSPKLRFSRAKEHIDDFEVEVWQYLKTEPGKIVVEVQEQTGYRVYKAKFPKPIPDRLSVLSSDAIEGLRSTLDQCTFAVGECAGVTGKQPRTYFPFGGTAEELERTINNGSKDLPPDVLALIRSFKPFRTGNDVLWAINAACNKSKHALLTPLAVAHQDGVYSFGVGAKEFFLDSLEIHKPVWDSAKREIRLATIGPNMGLNNNFEFTADIAFGKIEVIEGRPAHAVLIQMANMVSGILASLEAEARRLGLIS